MRKRSKKKERMEENERENERERELWLSEKIGFSSRGRQPPRHRGLVGHPCQDLHISDTSGYHHRHALSPLVLSLNRLSFFWVSLLYFTTEDLQHSQKRTPV